MPLPVVGNLLSNPNSSKLTKALLAHPPVTNDNATHAALRGNAAWVGNQLVVSDTGHLNYWYVPQSPDKVSYCVVPGSGRDDAYVISDQFGGCEWHVLRNAHFNLFAFLHVSRGFGVTADYTAAPGWALIDVRRSANLVKAGAHQGAVISGSSVISSAMGVNWAVSWVDRSGVGPVAHSTFVNVMVNQGMLVRIANSGKGPYTPPKF